MFLQKTLRIAALFAALLTSLHAEGCSDDQGHQSTECTSLLRISGGARSCDLLFDHVDEKVGDVQFSKDTKGVFIKRAPRLAVSMTAASDSALEGDAMCIEGEIDNLKLQSAACYDRLGRPLATESAVQK